MSLKNFKEWKEKNHELSKTGNIRDYTDLIHLVVLNNLENINSELIKNNLSQRERLIKLNNIARKQMEIIKNNYSYKQLNDSIHLKIILIKVSFFLIMCYNMCDFGVIL